MVGTPQEACPHRLGRGKLRLDLAAPDAGGLGCLVARPSQPHLGGDGWRGSQYRRSANGARRAPEADHAPFYEDSLEDVGR